MSHIINPINSGIPGSLGPSVVVVTIGGEQVKLEPPLTARFIHPEDQETVPSFKSYQVQIASSGDTARVRFYLNSTLKKSVLGNFLSYRWRPRVQGSYELKAIPLDTAGVEGSPSIIYNTVV